MKASWFARLLVVSFAAALVALPATASACSVCMGDPASKTAGAVNGAIFLLLGFVALMLSSVGAFAYHLKLRANSLVPPQTEIASTNSASEDSK